MSERERESLFNPVLLFRQAQATAGIRWFMTEAGRNALLHGGATQVIVNLDKLAPSDPEPMLTVLDNGRGMNAQARRDAGSRLGWSTVGNGSGLRVTALTLAQFLQIHTVDEAEPGFVYTITLPLVDFVYRICDGTWKETWERIPRAKSRFFPQDQPHGTLIALYDFRAAEPREPRNAKIYRSTRGQMTVENIRRHIPLVFPPDQARLFVVNGTRVQPKPFEGDLLWKEAVSQKPELGKVSGEIRLSDTAAGNWLLIGGTTATVPVTAFLEDFEAHNPDLVRSVPPVLRERRLTGIVRIELLERYPTPDRAHLLSSFFTGPEAIVVVDELKRIAATVAAKITEYDELPHSHVTESLIAEFVANMHAALGIAPGAAPGGEGPPTATDPVLPNLRVVPAQVHLDPWNGSDARDTAVVAVTNPLPGEEFVWHDLDGCGLIAQHSGAQALLQAIRDEGDHLIDISSRQYPSRKTTVVVKIKQLLEITDASGAIFRLTPMATRIEVGQERTIRIKNAGKTSGPYEWRIDPSGDHRGKPTSRLVSEEGGHAARTLIYQPGKYVVTCVCKKTKIVATCALEALARRADTEPSAPLPDTPDGPGGSGTGDAARERPSPASGLTLNFDFDGVRWVFTLRPDPSLKDPFMVDPENRVIHIGDRGIARFETTEARRRHTVGCAADGIGAVLMDRGHIAPGDFAALAQFIGDILDKGMPRAKE